MPAKPSLLAVIPARGGSKGLPGKNIRPFAGLPLIAHSIRMAQSCPEITRTIVTTDSPEIAEVARKYGADTPFMRPTDLAKDETPLWSALRHALEQVETIDKKTYDFFVLLDPTTPCRLPKYLSEAFAKLTSDANAVGIIGVSQPDFSPIWHSVVNQQGYMSDLISKADGYSRRQDVPTVYRINGTLYIWRTDFMRQNPDGWRNKGKHLMYEVPDFASISIDNESEFKRAELFVTSGLFPLPWLDLRETSCVR